MCCFSGPVLSVSDTNIFARLEEDGWQYLVYQMQFETDEANAIILPLPIQLPATDEDSLHFISLKGYDHFFSDLELGFPRLPRKEPYTWGARSAPLSQPQLKVHDVGDFVASFVPQISDFDRLDPQFRISSDTWDNIPLYKDYGFAVFQLKSRKGQPHPMAFKFRSRLNTGQRPQVFFPTVHIHDGEVHAREHFDHALFLQAPSYDEVSGRYLEHHDLIKDPSTGYVRSKWTADKFCDIERAKGIVTPDGLVHRLEMRGLLTNSDVFAPRDLHATSMRRWAPWLLGSATASMLGGFAGLSWFIERRNRVAEEEAKGKELPRNGS